MTAEEKQRIEASHKTIQESADIVLGLAIKVIGMSYTLGKALEAWKASLPKETKLEPAAESEFSPDLQAWLDDYLTIGAMNLADPVKDSKPSQIQKAMKILQLIPPIVTTKKK